MNFIYPCLQTLFLLDKEPSCAYLIDTDLPTGWLYLSITDGRELAAMEDFRRAGFSAEFRHMIDTVTTRNPAGMKRISISLITLIYTPNDHNLLLFNE